ncbi:hypothetical protein F5Y14DRAFT_445770 [Nemania sp. NC0429]|nr:hypothetical protein F5Y14DRAFT_445770 [Nemania sp. NC0429]
METPSGAQLETKDADTRINERGDDQHNQNTRTTLQSASTVDNDGNTILHLAARKGMVERCQVALQDPSCRAIVNSKNKDGETPLHVSCAERNRTIADILLRADADINATDNLGLTPLHCAIIAQGTFEENIESDDPEDTSLVELLLADKNLDKNIKTFHQGATPLHLAAAWAFPNIVALLIKNGTTWRGETGLHWAFEREMREDEENHPERMVPYLKGSYDDDSSHCSVHDKTVMNSPKIARYGQKLISAFDLQTEQGRWRELLRIAYQEKDESMVRYSANRLYPGKHKKERELVTLWLAMRQERFDILKEGLLSSLTPDKKREWISRNVLDLAAHQGLYEVVKWLLKSNLWSQKERKDAERRVPEKHRSVEWQTVWGVPFLQDGRKEDENYRYPQESDDNKFTPGFQSSIFNFYTIGRYTHFLHHLCNVRELLYNGEKGPVQIIDEKAKSFKDNFPELNTEAYDDSNLRFRWVHLPVNCDATTCSFKDKEKNPDYFTATTQFLLHSWHELPGNSDKDKYMNPAYVKRKALPSMRSPQPADSVSDQLALYMPYITFWRPSYKTETEMKLQSAEEAKTRIIHRPKTLDTYHFGTTSDAKAQERDADQVVFRYLRTKIDDPTSIQNYKKVEDSEIPILHIGQLWLPVFKNVLNYLNDNRGQLGRDIIPQSLEGFVSFITSFYINTPFNLSINLTQPRDNDDERESVHDIFLRSIERVNSEESRLRSKSKQEMYDQDEGKKIDGDKTMHSSVTETIELLSEIKDIKQELDIISSVVQAQSKVWDQLTNRPRRPDKPLATSRGNESTGGAGTAEYVLRRIGCLLRFTEETQENGTTLIVFTTVTILFTPLSFLAALFALNISISPHSGSELLYEPGWLFDILFGVTVILAYLYRHKFVAKKARKTAPRERNKTDHTESQKHRPLNRPPEVTHDSRAFKVWGKVQQLRTRKLQVERSCL